MGEDGCMSDEICGYKIDKVLGKGRYSEVYHARKNDTERAIKVVKVTNDSSVNEIGTGERSSSYYEQLCNDLLEEVQFISELSKEDNRYIVQYYEYETEQVEELGRKTTYLYIFMEYLKPLSELVRCSELNCEDVIQIGKDIAQALIICHENHILHRDIKPDNIFVSEKEGRNRKYKLGDFGISKRLKQNEMASTLKGTPMYMAPEVFMGRKDERSYGYSSDIYSLALILYVLLNDNRFPFLPDYPIEILPEDETLAFSKRMKGILPKKPIHAPKELAEVLEKALMDKDNRYQTAKEFLDAWNDAAQRLTEQEKKHIVSKVSEKNVEEEKTIPHEQEGNSILQRRSISLSKTEIPEDRNKVTNIIPDNINGGEIPPSPIPIPKPNLEIPGDEIKPKNGIWKIVLSSFLLVVIIVVVIIIRGFPLNLKFATKNSSNGEIEKTQIITEAPTENRETTKKETITKEVLEDTVEWKFKDNILVQYLGLEKEITLPKGIEGIGEGVFADRMDLISVIVPRGTYIIEKKAFQNCANLEKVELPESLKEIQESAFAGCLKLGNVMLSNTITKIGNQAFCRCSSVTEWDLPDQLMEIGEYAFMGNSNITEVVIPPYTETIGSYAFQGCSKLKEVTIPETVTEIGDGCFSMCSTDIKIICAENSKAHEYALQNKIPFEFQ